MSQAGLASRMSISSITSRVLAGMLFPYADIFTANSLSTRRKNPSYCFSLKKVSSGFDKCSSHMSLSFNRFPFTGLKKCCRNPLFVLYR